MSVWNRPLVPNQISNVTFPVIDCKTWSVDFEMSIETLSASLSINLALISLLTPFRFSSWLYYFYFLFFSSFWLVLMVVFSYKLSFSFLSWILLFFLRHFIQLNSSTQLINQGQQVSQITLNFISVEYYLLNQGILTN